jgi:hypothetical protein
MNTTPHRRLLRWILTALAAAGIALGATGVIHPAFASAAPPVTPSPQPPAPGLAPQRSKAPPKPRSTDESAGHRVS